jgi:hypothetical protein
VIVVVEGDVQKVFVVFHKEELDIVPIVIRVIHPDLEYVKVIVI